MNKSIGTASAAAALVLAAALSGCGSDSPSESAAGSSAPSAAAGPTTVKGMNVVLFDDDSIQGTDPTGKDGLGVYQLRKSLCAAGANVLVVAPWTVQSGQGSRVTLTGEATVQAVTAPAGFETDCGSAPDAGKVFGVCTAPAPCVAPGPGVQASPSASPTDAAVVALTRFLPDNFWPDGPDLVVSGVNYGQNDGATVISSGTTNAAVTAHRLGYPAIAVSEELVMSCLTDEQGCPQFTAAADFTTRLIGDLAKDRLITDDMLLNINYPHLGAGEQVESVQVNVSGECSALNFGPKPPAAGTVGKDGGTYELGVLKPCTETVKDADTTALAENHISIVSMDGNWSIATGEQLVPVLEAAK